VDRLVNYLVRRITIEGSSMSPTYLEGERVTAIRRWRKVHPGDVVVLRDPRESSRWLLKRCAGASGRLLDLRGDNVAASTDSRHFGQVPGRDISYIVLSPRPSHDQ
jgi:signal peptidase I